MPWGVIRKNLDRPLDISGLCRQCTPASYQTFLPWDKILLIYWLAVESSGLAATAWERREGTIKHPHALLTSRCWYAEEKWQKKKIFCNTFFHQYLWHLDFQSLHFLLLSLPLRLSLFERRAGKKRSCRRKRRSNQSKYYIGILWVSLVLWQF